MNLEDKKELLDKINHEIEMAESDSDIESVEKMIDDYLGNQEISFSKRDAKKMADKIIKSYSKTKPVTIKINLKSTLVPIIAVLLTASLIITAVAQKDFFMNGVIWLGEKLNIITSSSTSTNEAEQTNEKAVKEIFASGKYYLPHNILSDYEIKSCYENSRPDECTDICLELVNNASFINIIISNYGDAEAAGIQSPSANMKPEKQITVNGLDIYIFRIDKTYTIYYSADNAAYQIATDMAYDDLCAMINSIHK